MGRRIEEMDGRRKKVNGANPVEVVKRKKRKETE